MLKPKGLQQKSFRELSPKLLVTIADCLRTEASLNNFIRILRYCLEYFSWYDEREHNFFQRNDQRLLDGLIDFFHLKATMQLPFPFGPTDEMNAIKSYVRDIGIYDESGRVTENVPSFGMQIYELFKRFDHCEEPLSRYFCKICDVSLLGSDMVSPYKVVLDPLTQRIPIIIFCMDPVTWNCTTLKYFVETMEETQTLIITTCCRMNETPISTIRYFRQYLRTYFVLRDLRCRLIIWCLKIDESGRIMNLFDLPYLKY